MSSIIQHLRSNETAEQHSLNVLIELIELEYPDEDIDDITNLRKLIKKEFDIEFSESEIINHYVVSLEEEDARLQYKHLNITL